MDTSSVEKINSILTGATRAEFFIEQILSHYNMGSTFILECLGVVEIFKLYFKFKKYIESRDRIMPSEELPIPKENPEEKKTEKHIEKLFFKPKDPTLKINDIEKLKEKLSKSLKRIRATEIQYRNPIFNENFGRTDKDMNIISNLPIPEKIKTAAINSKGIKRIRLAELIHMIRPLVYCLCQIHFGANSYKPYFVSLVLDIIRMILQWKIEFYDPKEIAELRLRKKDIIINYLLRNPFYTEILKNKILIPLLDKLFPKFQFLKKIIIYIIEIRSSLSLLM